MLRSWAFIALALTRGAFPQAAEVKTFQHPSGISFQYPAAWELRRQGNLLALIPEGFVKDEKGQPLELLLLGSEPAPGIASSTDPRVSSFLEDQLRRLFPVVKRVRNPEPFATPLGTGAAITFESVQGGVELRQRIYVLVHEQTGIFLAHIARRDIADKRDASARQIFTSFRRSEPQVDQALLHTWRRENYSRSNDATSSVSNSTNIYWRFLPDGTVLYSTRSQTFADTAGLGVTASADSSSGVARGKYWTQNGVLNITWSDGTRETYEYNVFRASFDGSFNLGLKRPGQEKIYYTLVR
jgi:hypothetical protein